MHILTIIILLLLLAITLVFLIRSKLITIMSLGLKFGFIFFILLTLSALFIKPMYSKLADMTLKQFGIHESIQKIDYKLSLKSVTEPAEDLWEDIENLFGDDINDSEITEIEEMETGYFEKNLYPKLINLVTIIYRFFVTLFSLAGLIVIVYLSYITSGITDLDNLERKYHKLDKRIQSLEKSKIL